MDQLMPGADKDMVKPLHTRIPKRYEADHAEDQGHQDRSREGRAAGHVRGRASAHQPQRYDRVLMAVVVAQRSRNWCGSGWPHRERTRFHSRGHTWTTLPNIYAIVRASWATRYAAHKAVHEGKVAAENIAGHKAFFEPLTIPSVALTPS